MCDLAVPLPRLNDSVVNGGEWVELISFSSGYSLIVSWPGDNGIIPPPGKVVCDYGDKPYWIYRYSGGDYWITGACRVGELELEVILLYGEELLELLLL